MSVTYGRFSCLTSMPSIRITFDTNTRRLTVITFNDVTRIWLSYIAASCLREREREMRQSTLKRFSSSELFANTIVDFYSNFNAFYVKLLSVELRFEATVPPIEQNWDSETINSGRAGISNGNGNFLLLESGKRRFNACCKYLSFQSGRKTRR